jgi:molybdopterin-guanine dinucleotide biosynthesis protein A
MNMTGIILAGGMSSRMGKDKGLVLFKGKPLIEYALSIMKNVSAEILISTNNPDYDYLKIPLVKDTYNNIGPMGGIHSCLLKSKSEWNCILSCDMPLVKPELFQYLMQFSENAWVVLPTTDGIHPEPMCGIYNRKVLPLMEQFINARNYKLPDLFRSIPFKMILISNELDFYSDDLFMNLNSLEEIKSAERKQ